MSEALAILTDYLSRIRDAPLIDRVFFICGAIYLLNAIQALIVAVSPWEYPQAIYRLRRRPGGGWDAHGFRWK